MLPWCCLGVAMEREKSPLIRQLYVVSVPHPHFLHFWCPYNTSLPPSLPVSYLSSLDSFSDDLLKFRANVSAAVEEYEAEEEEVVSSLPTVCVSIKHCCKMLD